MRKSESRVTVPVSKYTSSGVPQKNPRIYPRRGKTHLGADKKKPRIYPRSVLSSIDADRIDQMLVGKRKTRSAYSTFFSRPQFSKFRNFK